MSANTDVEQGILNAWMVAKLNGASAGSAGGGVGTGPVTGGIWTDKHPRPRPTPPYATLEVRQDGKPNEMFSTGDYIDYRRVKVTLYGVGKTAMGALASTVLQVLWRNGAAYLPLTIPNASWMRTDLANDDIDITEPVAGDDVRAARMEFVIWSQRRSP